MKYFLLLSFSFLFGLVVLGQRNSSGPILGIKLANNGTKDLFPSDSIVKKDTTIGTYGTKSFIINGIVPIYTYIKVPKDFHNYRMAKIFLNGSFNYTSMHLSLLRNKHNIIRSNLGIFGFLLYGNRSTWIGSFNSFIANDDYTIYTPHIRYSGMAIYQRKVSNSFQYRLGMVYTYNFGSGLLLPILGMQFKVKEKGNLMINFPFNITYIHRKSDHYTYRIYLRQTGQVATLTNQFGEFNTMAPEVTLRTKESRLGWTGIYKLKNQWGMSIDAAFTGNRNLYVSDKSSGKIVNLARAKIKGNIYFAIGVQYTFKKKEKTKNKTTEEKLINEIDWNSVDESDLL